jgi:diguanylate cyclase (GGDEF)-like protein
MCGGVWLASNSLAGLQYSLTVTWFINTGMQAASFATVGLLIAVVRKSLARERELSRSDPLTSMLNRKGFYEEAARLIALCRRAGRPLTTAYIDLDNFKAVNDELGHERGDEVLKTAAGLLKAAIRPSDVAARIGGDEFIVLFPELAGSEATAALERIRAALAGSLSSGRTPVSASIGGVTFAAAPDDIEDMIRAGDTQMYSAKAAGRNRVALHVFGDAGTPARPSAGGHGA